MRKVIDFIKANMDWLFGGIGTELILLLIPALLVLLPLGILRSNKDAMSEQNQSDQTPNETEQQVQVGGDNNVVISIGRDGNVVINTGETDTTKKPEEPVLLMSRSSFVKAVEAASINEGKVVFHHYADYDNDGDCELFALVGATEKDEFHDTLIGCLWYADTKGVQKIESNPVQYWNNADILSIGEKKILTLNEFFQTGTVPYLWSVWEDRPYELELSGRTYGLLRNAWNEYEAICSTYDAGMFSENGEEYFSGHTWKHYWYYFDGKNLREYGGLPISLNDFSRMNGAEEVLWKIKDKIGNLDSIYYRSNGVLNLNFATVDEEYTSYEYINLRYQDGYLSVLPVPDSDDFYGAGFYLKALNEDIADFPTSFPY